MLEQIEKFFPSALIKLRRLPRLVRAALLVAVIAVVPSVPWIYGHQAALTAWLQRQVHIPLYAIILAALVSITLPLAGTWLARKTRARRDIRRFLADWLEFKEQFAILCLRIDAYRLKDREVDGGFVGLHDLLPSIRQYWDLRGRLRENIFRIGEDHLALVRSRRWDDFKGRSLRCREGDFLTPFSFITDLGNPIAEWNSNQEEIWEALHLADEFVEYLRFQYPMLKKIRYVALTRKDPLETSNE